MSDGPIATARAYLASLLAEADVSVIGYVPERLEPPCLVITEATPLLEPGEAFGSVSVRLTVSAIAAPVADNALALARLDELVDTVVVTLWPHMAVSVDAYMSVTGPDSQPYLAATITTTISITL